MNTEATPTLPHYLRILWRRKWALLLPVLLATATSYGLARSQRPQYEAHTDLLFRAATGTGESASQPADVPTEQRVAVSPAVVGRAVRILGDGTPAGTVMGEVSAQQIEQLSILRISARDPSPVHASRVVAAVSAAYLDFRRERAAQNAAAVTAALVKQTQALSAQLQELDRQLTRSQPRGGTPGQPVDGGGADPALQALRARRDLLLGQLAVSKGRLDELSLQAATQVTDVSVIVPATSSGVPVEPRPLRTTAIGALLGLLVGFGLVLVREQLNRAVHNVEEVEQAVGASVRSMVPRVSSWRRRREARLVIVEDAMSPTAEAYRILQASLGHLEVGTTSRILVLTSAVPGEGKSTTAANLAIAFAEAGVRTTLVDADLRHPRLHKFFKVDNRTGLGDILTSRSTFEEVVDGGGWREAESGLALLTAGRPLGQPTKALGSPALAELVARLRERGLVIFDTPPTLPVADAAVLAAHADAVLVVANPSVSSRPALEQLRRRLPSFGAKVLGVVLNSSEANRLAGEDYAYSYAYASEVDRAGPRHTAERARRRRSLQPTRGR
ncbi:MAG TPA: polysaccharide biosynthesis tyrosine autokinase [Actinomycetota bacterium]|jgi:capsular exopolysaccharide synthesis family protein